MVDAAPVDDIRFGTLVRSARVARGWRQRDLARAARISDATVSRVERGHLEGVSVGTLRRIASALDIRVDLVPRSRSANLERLVSARHSGLAESVIRWLGTFGGWIVRPEVSFSRFGERGVIDLLVWHPGRRALLVIELKTAIVDVGELLGTLDRKVRNALEIARELGWDPVTVSCVLIVADGATNRRRVAAHGLTFRASLPSGIAAFRRWLKEPIAELRALVFFADRHQGQVIQQFDHRQRVTVTRRRSLTPRSSVAPIKRARPIAAPGPAAEPAAPPEQPNAS